MIDIQNLFLAIGQEIITGEWIYGFYHYDKHNDSHFLSAAGLVHKVYQKTICRCSALPDINGELIFECDLVETKEGRGRVVWDECAWAVEFEYERISFDQLYDFNGELDIEIIARVYDSNLYCEKGTLP